MAAPARPLSAPKTVYVQLMYNGQPLKCSQCTRSIVGKAFTEISGDLFSKVSRPLCSRECFNKYHFVVPNKPASAFKPYVAMKKPPMPDLSAKIAQVNADIQKANANS